MQKIEREVRPNQVGFEYPTMSEDELAAFPVPHIAADDCHLFCWTTQKFLFMANRLIEAWGFRYVCQFVWHKPGGVSAHRPAAIQLRICPVRPARHSEICRSEAVLLLFQCAAPRAQPQAG